MKIFAKRKKTAVTPGGGAVATSADGDTATRAQHASDPIVEALLQKDPSTWNAKERRMVKRYQDRNGTDTDSTQPEQQDADENGEDNSEEDHEQPSETAQEPVETATKDGENDKSTVQLESILEPSLVGKLNSKQRRKLSRMLMNSSEDEVLEEANKMVADELPEAVNAASKTSSEKVDLSAQPIADDGATLTEEKKVKKLLDSLNSKQKRTLSRKLDREGADVLAEVRKEAEDFLNAASKDDASPDKTAADSNNNQETSGTKRKRRRGGTADLSALTPEERLRREEQRKRQKEAAERRASGETESSGRKHPLNSERRRANRRKPKWTRKGDFSDQIQAEHNASGFNARQKKREKV